MPSSPIAGVLASAWIVLALPASGWAATRSLDTKTRASLSIPVALHDLRLPTMPLAAAIQGLQAKAGLAATSPAPMPAAPLKSQPMTPAPAQPAPSLEHVKDEASNLFTKAKGAPPGATDETAWLKRIRHAVKDGRAGPLPQTLKKLRIILVPGFAYDVIPNYMETNLKRLRALGLDAVMVDTDPLGSTKDNAPRIAAIIEQAKQEKKRVAIIGHSNGANQSLGTLRRFPKLQSNVSCLITIQTPYGGTALADWFFSHPWIYTTVMAYSRLLNPARLLHTNPFFRDETIRELLQDNQSLRDLSSSPLPKRIKILSVASRVKENTSSHFLLRLLAGAVKAVGGRDSDGLVVPEQAIIPGSRFAFSENVSHIDPVAEPGHWTYSALAARRHDPNYAANLTEAILRWAYSKPTASPRKKSRLRLDLKPRP